MAGIQLTKTGAVSSTSATLTLPASNLKLVGVACGGASVSGYSQTPINPAQQAIFGFDVGPRGVTAVGNVVAQANLPAGMWLVNGTPMPLQLIHQETGLTSGTMFYYFGTPFSTPSQTAFPLAYYAAVAQSFINTTPSAFTFPGGPVFLNGMVVIPGYGAGETNFGGFDFSFNTAAGVSIDVLFTRNQLLQIIPTDHLKVAQSLTVTYAADDGTHVATGYLILYYSLS